MVNDGKNWEEKGFSASDEKLVLRMSKITWNPIKWASVSFTSLTQNSYLYIHFKIPVLGCRIVDFFQPSNVVVKVQQLVIMKKRTSFPTAIHQASKPGNKKRCQAECQKRHHKLPFGMSAIETLFWPYCIPFFIFHTSWGL